jgi:ABC-type phosphate/phosphonate transport system substrate-binding protein
MPLTSSDEGTRTKERSDKRMTRRQSMTMLASIVAAMLAPEFCRGANDKRPLRIAISVDTLAGANVNDARAAYLVWLREVARYTGTHTAEVVPEIFLLPEDLIRDVRQGSLDCYGVTAPELAKLVDLTVPEEIVIQDYLAEGMEYVLLVHNSGPIKKIADLRGAQIVSHLHRDMVLVPAWLGTMLASSGLPQPEHFFASQKLSDKINQVVLPVFFRRVDAACLARRNWEMAVELNPQLGRDLRPLAVSPKVIPIGFFFRCNTNADSRKALIQSIQTISTLTAGQQIVALYQSRAFVVRPLSAMRATLEMVRQFDRVSRQQPGARKGPG